MQLGRHLRELWDHKLALTICFLLASFAALSSVAKVGLVPPRLEPRAEEMAAASTRVLVDAPKSSVLNLSVSLNDLKSSTNRALLVANVMASAPVREYIARRAHVPADVLQVASPVTPEWPRPLAQTGNEKHTSDILKSTDQYRLSLQANPTVPVVEISAQAPTAKAVEQLANGAVDGMRDYLRDLGAAQQIPETQQVNLEQLGRAKGGVLNPGVSRKVAALSFFLVLAASCAAVLFISRVRRGWSAEAIASAERATAQG